MSIWCVKGVILRCCFPSPFEGKEKEKSRSICGSVVEYIVAIDVTRVRFPADAINFFKQLP